MDLLWTDFLNSEYHNWRVPGQTEERLEKPQWLAYFLQKWQLCAPVPPQPQEMVSLLELRRLLQRMAQHVSAGEGCSASDIQQLNLVLSHVPLVRRLSGGNDSGMHLDLISISEGWTEVMGRIAADFAGTLSEGEARRIRYCENPDCLWVFYDDTRNRSKRFCDEKMCGNLMKVRRFRARKKAAVNTDIQHDNKN